MKGITNIVQQSQYFLIVLLAFLIPISTSLTSVAIVLFLISWLFNADIKLKVQSLFNFPIVQATSLLLIAYFIGMVYAGYTHDNIPWQDRLQAMGKEGKIFLILFWIPILQPIKIRQYALWSFILAVSLTLVLGYIRQFTTIPIPSHFMAPYVFKDSIHTSFILCFAVFMLIQFLYHPNLNQSVSSKFKFFLVVIILSGIFYLFYMSHGRVGYFLFLGLTVLLLRQLSQQFKIKFTTICLSIGLLITIPIVAYWQAPLFRDRVNSIKEEALQYYNGNAASSVGSRIEFLRNSLELIKEHPIIGYGTGSFKSIYRNKAEQKQQLVSENPHNQYIRLIIHSGIIGCLILIYWIFTLLKECRKMPQFEKNCAQGMLLAMGLGCLANSWMADFTSGYLFVYWIAYFCASIFPVRKPEKLSVIVTTYNWPKALGIVLESLCNQRTNVPYEIIIADDGSREETTNLIKFYQDMMNNHRKKHSSTQLTEIKHIWHEDKGFRAAAIRNKAIQVATGDYIIFLDGDSVPRIHYLEWQSIVAERGYFVAGNRVLLSKIFTEMILSSSEKIYQWPLHKWCIARLKGYCNRLSSLYRIPLGLFRFIHTKQWKGAKGCNLAVWKQDLLNVNGWDERFSGWGYEDSDLVIRLIRAGVKRKDGRYLVPVIHLWHKENDRSQERNNWFMLQKNFKQTTVLATIGLKESNGIS